MVLTNDEKDFREAFKDARDKYNKRKEKRKEEAYTKVVSKYEPQRIFIFKVSKRKPPVNCKLIRWHTKDDGTLLKISNCEVVINIPKTQKEYALIPWRYEKLIKWSDGEYIHENDRWSFRGKLI